MTLQLRDQDSGHCFSQRFFRGDGPCACHCQKHRSSCLARCLCDAVAFPTEQPVSLELETFVGKLLAVPKSSAAVAFSSI